MLVSRRLKYKKSYFFVMQFVTKLPLVVGLSVFFFREDPKFWVALFVLSFFPYFIYNRWFQVWFAQEIETPDL